MERSYTDEELANIDPPPFEFEGKTYTAYEATQKQRQIETAMRAQKRKMEGYKAAGDDKAYQAASTRYKALSAKYKQFSKAAGLPEQRERLYMAKNADNSLAFGKNSGTISGGAANFNQEAGEANIPSEYVGDYSECEPLQLTTTEREAFGTLREAGDKTGHEYGCAVIGGKQSEPFTSKNPSGVEIPKEYLEADDVKLYHCHTNETVLSLNDLAHLTRANVREIGVVTSNGDVFTARRGYGDLVTEDEYYRIIEDESIVRKAYAEAVSDPAFYTWTEAQRSYARIRSQMRLIVRRFGWSISGGGL